MNCRPKLTTLKLIGKMGSLRPYPDRLNPSFANRVSDDSAVVLITDDGRIVSGVKSIRVEFHDDGAPELHVVLSNFGVEVQPSEEKVRFIRVDDDSGKGSTVHALCSRTPVDECQLAPDPESTSSDTVGLAYPEYPGEEEIPF